ncbi:hypothetical protein Btru_010772 [Bulinus truncatus]|nr:hypothetical protein Btru_010772 [Bulinus truncatus]
MTGKGRLTDSPKTTRSRGTGKEIPIVPLGWSYWGWPSEAAAAQPTKHTFSVMARPLIWADDDFVRPWACPPRLLLFTWSAQTVLGFSGPRYLDTSQQTDERTNPLFLWEFEVHSEVSVHVIRKHELPNNPLSNESPTRRLTPMDFGVDPRHWKVPSGPPRLSVYHLTES